MPRDAASQVLSGLLTNDVSLIDEVQRRLGEEHFTDPTLRQLYSLILTYRSISQGGVLGRDAVEQFTSKVDAGTAALMREVFDALVATPVTPDVCRWQVHEMRGLHELRLTQIAMREASDILAGSIAEEPDAMGRPGRTWSGPADAREYLARAIGEIQAEVSVAESPAADVLREGRAIIEDYVKARDEDKSRRPMTGIEAFDTLTGGLGKGLIMVAAPSGLGKTQWCVSLAYHASQMQGLHVYFATSETVRVTVRARMVARHSMHEKFAEDRDRLNLPHGLDSQKIDRGLLNPDHVSFLAKVAIDWGAQGQTSSDGTCMVAQMPHGQTMTGLAAQIDARSRVVKPDLVIIDYLALMSSLSRRYASSREELSAIVKEAAHFSVDFNKGQGVPTVSPWQLNRESQKEMVRTGQLDTTGLAETAEAVNSAHLVVALSPDGTRDGRIAGLRKNILKSRDGQVLLGEQGIPLTVDYAASYFTQGVGAGAAENPFDVGGNGGLTDNDVLTLIPGGI